MKVFGAGMAMSSDTSQLYPFLEAQSVLTLAIDDEDGLWSAPVLYAVEIANHRPYLHYLSSSSSRHSRCLSEKSTFAASIYAPYQDNWQAIKGLQMQGQVTQLLDDQRSEFEALYFARFPEILTIIDSPSTEQEAKIAKAFKKSAYYRFSPTYIRMTDNSDSFANRKEWFF
jgi:uncharacterized protein YhbP (UPF0306 family)